MRFSSTAAPALACGAIVLISACSGGTPGTPAGSAVSNFAAAPRFNVGRSAAGPAALTPPRRLAVAEFFNPSTFQGVLVLNRSYKTKQTITDGVHYPYRAHYDSNGNLYIGNSAGKDVTEYDKRGTLTFTYSSGLQGGAGAVTVDQSGHLYVNTGNASVSSIVEYAQHSNTPLGSCSTSLLITGVAIDDKGNVFVPVEPFKGSGSGQILEFKHGLSGCKATTLGVKLGVLGGLVIDKHRNLVVSDLNVGVDIIPPPYTKVGSTITAGINSPIDVVLNGQQTLLYVVNYNYPNNNVVVDEYPSGTNVTTLGQNEGITEAEGVAAYR